MDDSISRLVAQYRKLKAQTDTLKDSMGEIKVELQPLVEAEGGKWQDAEGYAKIVQRKPSVSFDVKALDALIASSDVASRMLRPHRRQSPGAQYLQIK